MCSGPPLSKTEGEPKTVRDNGISKYLMVLTPTKGNESQFEIVPGD